MSLDDLTAPLRLRRRRRLIRWTLRIAALCLVLGLVGAGTWAVRFSHLLDLRTVHVEQGADPILTPAQITRAARLPMHTPLAATDLGAATLRIEALPPVADATVHRSWPHAITIDVVERTPAFALRQGSHYQLVDAEGVAYHRVAHAPKGLVPIAAPGADQRLLAALAGVVAALPDDLLDRVTRIEAPTPDGITLHLTKGVRIVWGDGSNSALKVQVAQVLLKVKGVQVVNVSAPGQPTTR